MIIACCSEALIDLGVSLCEVTAIKRAARPPRGNRAALTPAPGVPYGAEVFSALLKEGGVLYLNGGRFEEFKYGGASSQQAKQPHPPMFR